MHSEHLIAVVSRTDTWIISGVLLVGLPLGSFLYLYFAPAQRARRAIAALRPTPLAAVSDGSIGKVVGTVVLTRASLQTPFSKRTCVHYEVRIEELRGSVGHEFWLPIIHETRSCDFVLRDGVNTAFVEMARARVVAVLDMVQHSGKFKESTPEFESFLSSRGKSSKGWFSGNKTLRYSEGALEPGESVALLGLLSIEPIAEESGPEQGRRGPVRRIRVLRAPPGRQLLVTDDPKATA